MFQFHFLLSEFTALENVLLPMRAYGRMSAKEMNERAMIARPRRAGRQAAQSAFGGQRQRFALTRALANRREIIAADEPTGNLGRVTA